MNGGRVGGSGSEGGRIVEGESAAGEVDAVVATERLEKTATEFTVKREV